MNLEGLVYSLTLKDSPCTNLLRLINLPTVLHTDGKRLGVSLASNIVAGFISEKKAATVF